MYFPNNNDLPKALFYRTGSPAYIPFRATQGSAGYDLLSPITIILPPYSTTNIPTNIAILPPQGTYMRVASRSGLAIKHNLEVTCGVIDPDFTNGINVAIANRNSFPVQITEKDKIAQLIFEKYETPTLIESKVPLPTTNRGTAGTGSTGLLANHSLHTMKIQHNN